MRLSFLSGWILLGALADASIASAQYPQYRVNDDQIGEENRIDPVVALLPDGGYVVAWIDNARGHTDVLARTFDAGHVPETDAVRLNGDDGFTRHREVALGTSVGGQILCAWTDARDRGPEVWGRFLSSDTGLPAGGEFQIAETGPFGTATRPRVATQTDGTSLVVWQERPGLLSRAVFQLVGADASLISPERSVDETDPFVREQGDPTVAPLANGGWILAWDDRIDSDWNVRYRVYDSGGAPAGDVHRANSDVTLNAEQYEPALVVRSSDILIAWRDDRARTSDVWGRWLDSDGAAESAPDFLLREAGDPPADLDPRLVSGPDDSFALCWFGGAGGTQRALFRLFGEDRAGTTPSILVTSTPNGVVMRGAVPLGLPDGKWLFVWSDDRNLNYQTYGQLRAADGSALGEPHALWRNDASASQLYPSTALFPDNSGVTVWGDLQSGLFNIRARLLDTSGVPVGESIHVNEVPVGHGFETIDGVEAVQLFAPKVAATGSGFIVTWAIDQEGGRLGLYGQLYDRERNRIGPNFRIPPPARDNVPQFDPRPIMYSDGTFAIAWRDNSVEEEGDIFLQRYGSDGLPAGVPVNVADEQSGVRARGQQLPAIARSPFDETAVVWIDFRFGGWDVFLQLFSPNGDRVGENQSQNPPDEPAIHQVNPSVAIAGDRIVGVWEEMPLTAGLIRGKLTILETLRGGGSQTRPARTDVYFDVNADDAPRGAKYPAVAMANDGRFVVSWWDNSDGVSRLWVQRYDALGRPLGNRYHLSEGTGGSRLPAEVVAQGELLQFTWTDSRRAKGWDVWTRRVDWDFNGGPVPVSLTEWTTRSEVDGLVLVWQIPFDRTETSFRVYRDWAGAGVAGPSAGSILLTPEPLRAEEDGRSYRFVDTRAPVDEWVEYWLEDTAAHEFAGPFRALRAATPRLHAWPNPFRDSVRFALPTTAGRIVILDAGGRKIRTLSARDPSWWDGRDARGAIVPAGIYYARAAGVDRGIKLLRVR